jgi:3-oxoadipate enol-lactonase
VKKEFESCVVAVQPGLGLAVEVCGPKDAPVVILSNSIGSDRGMWDEVVERLRSRVRIVRYDTRGHGQSGIAHSHFELAELGRDVLRIMDHLEIDRATFCGLSLGGVTGMWLGANAPERFSGFVFANTAPSFPPADIWRDRAAAVRKNGMLPLVQATLDRWLTKPFQGAEAARTADIGSMIASTPAEGYAACCEVLAEADESGSLARLQSPVLVIVGEHDPSTPPSRGAEIVSAVSGAKMVRLDAAHLSAVEAPDAFAGAVLEFIGGLQA